MQLRHFVAQDLQGNVIPLAEVTVYEAGTEDLATGLQNSAGGALANPFDASAEGLISFAAADGEYDIRIVGEGKNTIFERIQFLDVSTQVATATAAAGVAVAAKIAAEEAAADAVAISLSGFISYVNGGVVYVNASGQLISINVLNFNGTNMGIGSAADATARLLVNGPVYIDRAANGEAFRFRGSVVGMAAGLTGSLAYFGTYTAHDFAITPGGTEVLRVTQSGGYLRMASGAGGIQFNGDTAAVNALDDYEEGTWTPTLPNGGTLTVSSATYTKIGRQVTVTMFVTSVTPTNDSSDFLIGGLPFTPSARYFAGSIGYVGSTNLNSAQWLVITGNSTASIWFHSNAGSTGRKINSEYVALSGSNDELIITITYFV